MRRLIIILCLLLLTFTALAHAEEPQVFALCFHTFWGSPKYPLDFSRDEFAAILDQFKAAGFNFVTMDQIFGNTLQGKKNILITIDDGNKSIYDAIHLVLQPRNIKPLLAIIAGSIENIPQDLTWDQVEELRNEGCYIAAHGWFHIMADERLFLLSPELFIQEIVRSRQVLENHLQQPVIVYVYPYGKHIIQDDSVIPAKGYLLAFGLDKKPFSLPLTATDTPYNLPRYMFTHENYQSLIDLIIREAN